MSPARTIEFALVVCAGVGLQQLGSAVAGQRGLAPFPAADLTQTTGDTPIAATPAVAASGAGSCAVVVADPEQIVVDPIFLCP